MRAFLALPLDGSARLAAARVQDAWRLVWPGEAVGWVVPENFHLTLRFLGEIPEDAIASIALGLQAAVTGFEPIPLTLARATAFPRRDRPSVLVLEAPVPDALADLVDRVDASLRPSGLGPRDRPFRAHLTLGRVKTRGPLGPREIRPFPEPESVRWLADRVVLFRSFTDPSGARYVALHEERLREAALAPLALSRTASCKVKSSPSHEPGGQADPCTRESSREDRISAASRLSDGIRQ